jgi:hypothetical protein
MCARWWAGKSEEVAISLGHRISCLPFDSSGEMGATMAGVRRMVHVLGANVVPLTAFPLEEQLELLVVGIDDGLGMNTEPSGCHDTIVSTENHGMARQGKDQREGMARASNLCLVERRLEVGVPLRQDESVLLRFLDLQAANLHLVLQYCIFVAVLFQELALACDCAADVAKLAVRTHYQAVMLTCGVSRMSTCNSLLQLLRASQRKCVGELTSSARSRSPPASASSPQPTGWRP